jgi:DnaJ-class molecular chaperone
LRDRGLPGAAGGRGNLYVTIQIRIPKKLSDAERKLWEQLGRLHGAQS